jgi:group I intron endonuclease
MVDYMKKISGIYAITNTVNNRIYIGSSNDISRRWSVHRSNLRKNKHGNKQMQEDYNNQSESDFVYSILEECLQRDLFTCEMKWNSFYCDKVYSVRDILNPYKKIRRGKESAIFKEKRSKQVQGEKNPHNTLMSEKMASEVLWLKQNTKMTYKEIAEKYSINKTNVFRVGYDRWLHSIAIKPDWYDDSINMAM